MEGECRPVGRPQGRTAGRSIPRFSNFVRVRVGAWGQKPGLRELMREGTSGPIYEASGLGVTSRQVVPVTLCRRCSSRTSRRGAKSPHPPKCPSTSGMVYSMGDQTDLVLAAVAPDSPDHSVGTFPYQRLPGTNFCDSARGTIHSEQRPTPSFSLSVLCSAQPEHLDLEFLYVWYEAGERDKKCLETEEEGTAPEAGLTGTLPPALQSPTEAAVTTKNQIPWKLKDSKCGPHSVPQCPSRRGGGSPAALVSLHLSLPVLISIFAASLHTPTFPMPCPSFPLISLPAVAGIQKGGVGELGEAA